MIVDALIVRINDMTNIPMNDVAVINSIKLTMETTYSAFIALLWGSSIFFGATDSSLATCSELNMVAMARPSPNEIKIE